LCKEVIKQRKNLVLYTVGYTGLVLSISVSTEMLFYLPADFADNADVRLPDKKSK